MSTTKPMPWFRMYAEAVDDEKLRLLAFEDRWHYVALLCCKGAGLLDDGGPMTRRKVAVKLGVDMRTLDEVARRLAEVDLIDQETLQPLAWDKRQFRSDSSTDRVRAFREKKKREGNVSGTERNVSETPPDTDAEADTEAEEQTPPPAQAQAAAAGAAGRAQPAGPRKGRRAAGFDAAAIELPDWLDRDDWLRWVQHRREIRKPITEQSARQQLRELDRMRTEGHRPSAVIDQSIANGWQGLFPLRGAGGAPPGNAADRLRAWGDRLQEEIERHTGAHPTTHDLGVFDAAGNPVHRAA